MNRLNPRLPLVFDTRELGRRPGSMLEMQRTVPAPEDLGDIDVIAIPPGQPIELDLRLESVLEGVLVTGWAQSTATGTCVRCLDPITREVGARFQELFAYADRAAHHLEVATQQLDDDDEVYELVGDLFDFEPVLR
ncbi:MAG: YceD family protein, partial [Actinomycetota bacterium]